VVEDFDLATLFANNFRFINSDESISEQIMANRKITVDSFFKEQKLKKATKQTTLLEEDSKLINNPFNLIELKSVLEKVNINSSPGCDDIPFTFLKNSPSITLIFLLEIINMSWNTNVILANWKTAIIKPILKPNKDPNDLNSYRPISLTSTISKIVEKMIVVRLNWYLEKNNLLIPTQAGFRKSFSTNDPIIRLKHEADIAITSGNITVAILIDFTRAFDLLWVDGLLLKMLNLKISGNMLRWIKNFLSLRTSRVKIGNQFSIDFTSENGTPQGSSLSPILFLIMVNDFPTLSQYTSNALFADDCTIWRSGTNLRQIQFHLQQDLNLISEWCKKWGFQINTDKTMGIIFSNKTTLIKKKIVLKIDDKQVNFKNSCKLLGVTFDNHLTWKNHIDQLVNKSSRALNILRCISGSSWGSNKDTLLILYKSLILSNLDYCCFAYSNSALTNLKKLDTIQYKSLILATGGIKGTALRALQGECAEIPLNLRRQQIITKYLLKLSFCTNNAANQVLNDTKFFQLEIKRNSPYHIIVKKILNSININISPTILAPKICSWNINNDQVDLSYLKTHKEIKNRQCQDATLNLEKILDTCASNFKHLIFVDGSVQGPSKVGAAVYSPSIPITLHFKLPNRLSIHFTEAYAILQAL